jgi:predicted HTH domain antitoxin
LEFRKGRKENMVKAVIDLSEELYQTLSSHGLSKAAIAKESKKLLALKCYREKILSLGKSAELSGLSMWAFIEFLGENNVPVIDLNEEQLAAEFESVEKLRKAL